MSFVERSRACPFGSIPPKELGEENAVSAQNRSSNKARGILKKDEKAKLKRKRKEGSHRKELLQALVREETDKINDTK